MLARQVRRTLVDITGEINSRLVFGVGRKVRPSLFGVASPWFFGGAGPNIRPLFCGAAGRDVRPLFVGAARQLARRSDRAAKENFCKKLAGNMRQYTRCCGENGKFFAVIPHPRHCRFPSHEGRRRDFCMRARGTKQRRALRARIQETSSRRTKSRPRASEAFSIVFC